MKHTTRILLIASVFLASVFSVSAQARRPVTIKLASLVPENTPWGGGLNRLAGEWAAATNGEVKLQVYHGGIAGNEDDVLRKLRMNQIQAAVLSTVGLNLITNEIMTISCPFLIRDNAELEEVLNKIRPDLEKSLNSKGFHTMAWSRAGWIKVFSKTPVYVPADLRRLKLGTPAEQPELAQVFKLMGYQMVSIHTNDILVAFNNGTIESVYNSPIMIGGLQVFGIAKNMASINIAPVMGGILMNDTAWRAIPARYKPKLEELTRKLEREMDSSIMKLENDAIAAMTKYGLAVNTLSPEQEYLWYQDIGRAVPSLFGSTMDRNLYEKIETILKNFRGKRR
ncbi:MAG: TRAP transporter substrate-binding protein DctP [Treponema sp.]|nr:TRAP transporter substrate-binding protein DctP [Treponema sp.]